MESASVAHVCYVNNIPFIAIRSITDTEDHSGVANFEQNCKKAAIIAKDITVTNASVDFKVKIGQRNERIKVNIPGRYSVYNALAAVSIANAYLSLTEII